MSNLENQARKAGLDAASRRQLEAKAAALKAVASQNGFGIENAPGIGLTPEELGSPTQRMLELASKDTHYQIGHGGYRGPNGTGADKKGGLDCSGLISHGTQMARDPRARHDDGPYWKGKWLETSNIYRDATGPQERFELVHPDKVLPSDFATYPDYKTDGKQHQGHIMDIVDPVANPPTVVDSSESANGVHLRPMPVDKIGPENMQKMVYVRYKQPNPAPARPAKSRMVASDGQE